MTSLFSRLGIVGVSLVAGALIFGAITGGIVVHRLERPAAHVVIGGQGDQKDSQSPAKSQDSQEEQGTQSESKDSKPDTNSQSGSNGGEKDSD